MPNFYSYDPLNPSALNDPNSNSGHWENPADWPRTYLYVSAHQGTQGIHPPAPVYQSNQPAQPAMSYYFAGGAAGQPGYCVNGVYYGPSNPTAPTGTAWPYTCFTLPTPSTSTNPLNPSYQYGYSPYYPVPQPITVPQNWYQAPAAASQAAAAVAANAALAQMPNAPAYFVGATAAEIQAQNAIYVANMQASQSQPTQLAPFKPGTSPQFWCKELDGSWTLREYNDTLKPDWPAGHWEKHATSGYYYYVRHAT